MPLSKQTKKLLADFRKQRLAHLKARKERGECCSVLHHGPGHQSSTFCQLTGPHKIHKAVYGSFEQTATWRGKEKFTGFFDEPPNQE